MTAADCPGIVKQLRRRADDIRLGVVDDTRMHRTLESGQAEGDFAHAVRRMLGLTDVALYESLLDFLESR